MIPALILAAGASTRLGSPKQLALLAGETLLDRAVRTAREAGCAPIHVILGAHAPLIRQGCHLTGATVHLNPAWKEGMASSIRLGIQALPPAAPGVLILTCDMPFVTPANLRALITPGTLTASRYAQRNAVPAFFPASTFPGLLQLTGDTGARDLLRPAASILLDGGEVDIDTPADFALLSSYRMASEGAG